MRLFSLILVVMIIALPFAQAEAIIKNGSMYEITEAVKIERGEGRYTLNLSNPQDLEKYSPVENFWDVNLTGPGKIVDGILPPDIIFLNKSTVSLDWNFTLTSDEIANGASQFVLRLPICFNSSTFPNMNISISRGNQKVVTFDISKPDLHLHEKTIRFANLSLHLWYVNLYGLLYPGDIYSLHLLLSNIEDPLLLVYSYDYLRDENTEFYVDGKNYTGDPAVGFEFKQLTSNGISAIPVTGLYYQKLKFDKKYSGDNYVSFAYEIYASFNTSVSIRFETLTSANSTMINLKQGLNTIRGNLKLHFDNEDTVLLEISAVGCYLMVNGYSEYPGYGDIGEMVWMKIYGDTVVNSEEYYVPGAVVLPGNWQESMALAIKYAPPSYLPVILTQAEYYTTIYTLLKIVQFESYLLYRAMDFIGGVINDLLPQAFTALFNWVYYTVVHLKISDAAWELWAFLKAVWFLLQIGIYVLAVWFTDSFLRGIVALPERGVKGMLEEWQGVTSFIESLASRIRRWRK